MVERRFFIWRFRFAADAEDRILEYSWTLSGGDE
jgi:hypothetical protein